MPNIAGKIQSTITKIAVKRNVKIGEKELKRVLKEFPEIKSSSKLAIEHKNALYNLEALIDFWGERLEHLRDTMEAASFTTEKKYIKFLKEQIKKAGVANCGEYADITQFDLSKRGHKAKNVEINILNKQSGKLLEPINTHAFTVLGLKKNSSINDPATWGEKAVIVDAWSKISMKAQEGIEYFKKVFGLNEQDHEIKYYKSLNPVQWDEYNEKQHKDLMRKLLKDAKKMRSPKNLIKKPWWYLKNSHCLDYTHSNPSDNVRIMDYKNRDFKKVMSYEKAVKYVKGLEKQKYSYFLIPPELNEFNLSDPIIKDIMLLRKIKQKKPLQRRFFK